MTIFAYTGLPGSGKSYSVVAHQILPALRAGRRVVTNIPMRRELVLQDYPDGELVDLPTEKVQTEPACLYEFVTPGSVLVLDEVWRLFPAGEKANKVPEPYRKLLAEHRHMVDQKGNAVQIVLVTQDLAQISRFARLLVDNTFRTTKLTSVGMSGQFRVDVYHGPVEGPNPPENRQLRQMFGSYNSKVWKYYESNTMREAGAEGLKANEKSVDGRANVLRRPMLIAGLVGGPIIIAFCLWQLFNVARELSHPEQTVAAAPEATAAHRPPMPVTRSDEQPKGAGGSLVVPTSSTAASSARAVLVGYIENLEDKARSVALVSIGDRVLTRPLRFCSDRQGWLVCDFPDLGQLSL